MRIYLALLLLPFISACAPPMPAGDMMPMTQVYSQIPSNKTLERSVKLGTVAIPENAGGSIAPLKAEIFQEALQNALLTSNMAVRYGDKEKFILDAKLIELDVPMFGLDMTASSKARYTLTRVDSGFVVFDETINLPYTAEFAESFDGSQRARLATAKAIRENITHMIRLLASKKEKQLSKRSKK